jgi:hypothetical protein
LNKLTLLDLGTGDEEGFKEIPNYWKTKTIFRV